MKALIAALVVVALAGPALADEDNQDTLSPQGLLPPYQHNTYGPGVHADSTGRPFTYQPANPGNQMPVTGPVQRDGYGLGTHVDQFGRPVRDRPGW